MKVVVSWRPIRGQSNLHRNIGSKLKNISTFKGMLTVKGQRECLWLTLCKRKDNYYLSLHGLLPHLDLGLPAYEIFLRLLTKISRNLIITLGGWKGT